MTFGELDRRVAAIAAALHADHGVGPGTPLAVMCRNHRGFLEAMAASSRLGADLLLLNTELPASQLAQVFEREGRGVARARRGVRRRASTEAGFDGGRVLAWHEDGSSGLPTLDDLAATRRRPPAVLAPDPQPEADDPHLGHDRACPRARRGRRPPARSSARCSRSCRACGCARGEPMLIGPPIFHGFGLAFIGLALFLRCPAVLHAPVRPGGGARAHRRAPRRVVRRPCR